MKEIEPTERELELASDTCSMDNDYQHDPKYCDTCGNIAQALAQYRIERDKLAKELLEACILLEPCVRKASKTSFWAFEVAQVLIPVRDAVDKAIENYGKEPQ